MRLPKFPGIHHSSETMKIVRYLPLLSVLTVQVHAFSVSPLQHHADAHLIKNTMQRTTTPFRLSHLSTRTPICRSSTQLHASILSTDEDSKEEYVKLGLLLSSVSAFILVNQFVGPWPADVIYAVPEQYWLLLHYLGGTVFAGSILLSTCMEWLVVSSLSSSSSSSKNKNNNTQIQEFWFDSVPLLDLNIVVPSVIITLVAGTAAADWRYGSLASSPQHISLAGMHMIFFFLWWALTDVTTQSKAKDYLLQLQDEEAEEDTDNNIMLLRRVSNIGSCVFVLVLYSIMTIKPGLY